MLTKRTNLLLRKTDYQFLQLLARKQEVSIGELIRRAIDKTYKERLSFTLEQRKKEVAGIKRLWEKIQLKKVDYKSLIEYGRKY